MFEEKYVLIWMKQVKRDIGPIQSNIEFLYLNYLIEKYYPQKKKAFPKKFSPKITLHNLRGYFSKKIH